MKILRKWRRAWQRGKRRYYIPRRCRYSLSIASLHRTPARVRSYIRWASTAAAAVMLATAGSTSALAVSDTANNIHTDGRTATSFNITGNVNNITTGTIVGVNALNSFSQFNVKAGNIVNLHVPTSATNLINLVSGGRSQIDGMLNSIKDNKIGGNLFFLNPHGIVVGQGGSINTGSLTMYTPTQDFISNFFFFTPFYIANVTDGTLPISSSGLISIEGTVNTIGSVKLNSDNVTVSRNGVINTGAKFSVSDSFDTVVNINAWTGAGSAPTEIITNQDGSIEIIASDIAVEGTIAAHGDQNLNASTISLEGNLLTGGGDFVAHSDKSITVKGGAVISTRKVAGGSLLANHSDSSLLSTGDSGNITLTVNHETYKDKANIEISGGAKLLSFASNGKGTSFKGGDISIIASSQDKLYAWAMSGPDAEVKIKNATLKGNNITVQAIAKNDASKEASFEALEDNPENNASLENLKNSGDDFLTTLYNLRAGVVVSNVHAKAKVTLDEGAILQADKNVSVSSAASSAVNSTLLSVVGGVGVAKSKAEADTTVKKGAEIIAGDAVTVTANTKNTINMATMTIPYVAGKTKLNLMVTYGEMDSDAGSVVEAGAKVKAGGDVSVTAGSIKDLTVSASADSPDGGYFSAGVAVSKADVKADAEVAGTITAGGDVAVDAQVETLQNKTWSASTVGDGEPGSGLDLAVDWVANGIAPKLIKSGKASVPPSVGITGATAITLSKNTATAQISSKGDNYVQSQGNISVVSDVTDLMKSGAIARQKQRPENEVLNQPTPANKKAAGVSAAVIYSEYDNTSTAFIGDDAIVDAKKKLAVESAIHIPLPNAWADKSLVQENVQNAFLSDTLGIGNAMFSSWAQSSSDAGKGTGSASVNITSLTNEAEAYIGKRAKINQDTAFNADQAQNDVNVTASTDVTILIMAGMLKSPLDDLIKAARDKTDPMLSAFGATSGGSGAGGSVLVTFADNTTKAYIDAGSQVKAHNLTVDATTDMKNISIGAAGGKADKVGFNGTATVNDIANTTYAKILDATAVASEQFSLAAVDSLYNIDAAGGLTESGSVGIGVSIAYNNIVRDTQAVASGSLSAKDKLSVNAKNTGLAVTVSLAGAVTKDMPPNPEPTPEEESDDPIEYIRYLFGEDPDAEDPLSTVDKEISSLPTKDAAGQQAKSGVSVAGNVAINITDETALARLGGGTAGTTVTAKSSDIGAKNDTVIIAVSGAVGIAANAGGSSTGIGGAFMLNKVNETTQALADNASITITGTEATDVLNLSATNAADIVSIAASGGVSPKGVGLAGQVSLNMLDNTTQAGIDDSTVSTAKAVNVSADDQANITAVGGAAAYGGKTGIGASVAVNLMDNTTDAHIANSTLTGTTAESDLTVSASQDSQIVAVSAAVGASKGSMAGAFSATGNALTNITTASISGVKTGQTAAVDSKGDVTIKAEDSVRVTSIAGAAGVAGSGSGVGLGASAAVLTTDSAATAFLGDASKVKADNVSIAAESDQDILTIAAGGDGGGRAGIAGSASTNMLNQTSDAHIGKQAVVDAAGSVKVKASNTMTAKGFAGAVGIGKTAGVGVGADVSLISTGAYAYIDSGASVAAKTDVIVDAASSEDVISFAGGIAGGSKAGVLGSASVHVLNTDTLAFIGRTGDTSTTKANVTADGSVAVMALDESVFTGVAGSGAYGGKAGVDGSAAVDLMTKNTSATIGDYASIQAKGQGAGVIVNTGGFNISYEDYTADDMAMPSLSTKASDYIDNQGVADKRVGETATSVMNGVAVTAASQNTIRSVSVGAAASGAVAATGSAAVNVVNNTTTAHIGQQAKINIAASGAASQSVLVAAGSDFAQVGVGGALAGSGSVGVGAGSDVTVLNNETKAYIDQAAQVKATKDIRVQAAANQDLISAAAALGASGKVGVAGSAAVNVINSDTAAYIGANAMVAADNNVEVAAKDTTEIVSVAGGAGIGIGAAGVGGSVSVNTITKDTQAYIGAGAVVDANAQASETLNAFTGTYDSDGKRLLKAVRGVSVKAESSETITDVVASGGAGMYAGVAGAVAVNVDESTTKAYIGDNAKINNNNAQANAAQAVNVAATNDVKLKSVSGAAGGGIVGVSGGVDVGIVRNDTSAYVGGATVKAKDDISIQAMAKKDIASYAASLSGGAVGVAGSVSVYAIGANLSSDALVSLQANKDAKNANNPQEDNVQQYTDNQLQTKRYVDLLGQYDDANIRQAGTKLAAASSGMSVSDDINGSTAAPGGTTAFIGANAQAQADGSLKVTAQDTLRFKTDVGTGSVGGAALGGAVSVVNAGNSAGAYIGDGASVSAATVTLSSELNDQFTNTVAAGGLGMAGSLAGSVSVVNDSGEAKAAVGKVKNLTAGNIIVAAQAARITNSTVVGASAALAGPAVTGAMLANTVTGGAEASLGGTLTSSGDIFVQAETTNRLKGLVVAPSAGSFAGGAAVNKLNDTSGAKAFISSGGKIIVAGSLSVDADVTSETIANATGVGLGGIAIGAAVANSETSGQSAAYIDDNSVITAEQAAIIADSTNKAIAETTAGAGGLAVAGGSQASAVAKPVTKAYTGSSVTLNTRDDVAVAANTTPTAQATAKGYNFGALSVGVSLASANANPSVDSHIGGSNTVNAANLRVAANLLRQAGNDSVYANAEASGGGLIGVSATQSYASEQATVHSLVGDNSALTVSGTTTISAQADTKQNAIASAKSGGIVAAGGNYAEASADSVITAHLGSGAKLTGGELSLTASGKEYSDSSATAGIGGIVSGSAATAKTNATSSTQAYTDKSSHVTADKLALSADHTSQVNTRVDSLSASVAGNSGAVADNTVNSTVTATLNGNINTKKLTVKAINNLLKPAVSGHHVEAGSGGLLNGAAAKEDSEFTGKTTVSIGEGAVINIGGDKRNPEEAVFEALTNVDARSSAKLVAGGAIEIAKAESFIKTNTDTKVDIGKNSAIDSIGKVTMAAFTTSDVRSEAGVNVWGLAGSAKGESRSTITAANTVKVADNAKIRADDDINFYAGRSAGGKTNTFTARANTDLYNNTAIPISGSPKADTAITQTDSISLAPGSSIRSAADVNLLTEEGSVTSVGYGYAQDLYRKVLEEIGNAISNLFGGGDLSLATEYHSSTPSVADTKVVVDGIIETGIKNKQVLIIDPIRETDITKFSFDSANGSGQAEVKVTIRASDGVNYTITKENVVNNLINYRKQLVDLKAKYASDAQAVAAYTADIAYVDAQLEQMGVLLNTTGSKAALEKYDVYYLTVDDVKARGGNINVNAKTLTGSGSLQAPKDSAITIINNSPLYLRTNQLVLDNVGGHVNLNGVEVTSAADITARNQGGAVANLSVSLPRGASDVAVSKVTHSLNVSSNGSSDAFTVSKGVAQTETYRAAANDVPTITINNAYDSILYSGDKLSKLFTSKPNLHITASISNPSGTVSVYNNEGSIMMQGENGSSPNIVANTVDIKANRGSVYQSYTPGLTSIGGDPRSLWNEAVPGLESTADTWAGQKYDNTADGHGGIFANGSIYISGQYLNINGTIQSGIPDWNLTLNGNAKYSGTMLQTIINGKKSWKNVTLDEFIAAKQEEWELDGRNPNTKYQITSGATDPLGTIAAYYNPSTRQIELGDTSVQGGRVELFGQILNTGGGSIKALDGYGQINIVNNTNYDLTLNTLDTGNNIRGVVKITDTGKYITDASGKHFQVTQYQRNDQGKIQITVSHTGLNDAITTVSDVASRDVEGGYSPVTGTRYVWTLGRDKTTTTTTKYHNKVGNWGWDPAGWVTNESTKTSQETKTSNLVPLPNGAYVMVDNREVMYLDRDSWLGWSSKNIVDINLYRTYKNNVLSSHTTENKTRDSSGFLGYYKHYYTERITKTGSQDIYTFSAKADYPVAISFIGHDAGAIKVSGTGSGNLVLNSSVTNRGGEVTLTTAKSSIISGNTDANIAAKSITLSAGGLGNGIGANSPLSVQLLGETGSLTAKTAAGAINLNSVMGDLRLNSIDTQSGDKYGKVSISADGSILQATAGNNAVIRGSGIDLISRTGTIGTAAQALNVSVRGMEKGDNINALAAKDINLRQPDGDFRLGHVESRSGDVTIEAANGSLVDANPIEAIDERTLEQMNALWDRMQVKQGAGAEAANEQALAAYADGKRADYFEYWRLRQVALKYDANGNLIGYTANPYDPNFTYTATYADKAMFAEQGLTAAQQQQYIDNKTQIYRTMGAQLGDAAYDPNYQYSITDADRANLTSQGWTDSQLKYSLNIGIAKQTVSTDTTLQDPNVVGRHVKLIAKQGGVGTDNGEIVIDSRQPDVLKDTVNPDGSVTPSAARLALASAEGDDITIKGDNIHVALRQAIYVRADTLEAIGKDNVYIGSASPINVYSIQSGSRVNNANGGFDGNVRIKGKEGLYNAYYVAQKAAYEAAYNGYVTAQENLRKAQNQIPAGEIAYLQAKAEFDAADAVYEQAMQEYKPVLDWWNKLTSFEQKLPNNQRRYNEASNKIMDQARIWGVAANKWYQAESAWATLQENLTKAHTAWDEAQFTWDKAQADWANAQTQAVLNGGRTVIEAGFGGSIGTAEAPFSIRLTEGSSLTARAAGSIYLDSKADNLQIAEIYSESDLSLKARGDSVLISNLKAQNVRIDAAVDDLLLYNVTIGNEGIISNNYFTTIADRTLDPKNLPQADLILVPGKSPFYLLMQGSKADTNAPILAANIGRGGLLGSSGSGGGITLGGGAVGNDAGSMLNNAMNSQMKPNSDQQFFNQSSGNSAGPSTSQISFSIDGALQLQEATDNGQGDEKRTQE